MGCLILSGILLGVQFQHADEQATRERDSAFALSRALLQAVLNGHLERIDSQLTQLINQEELDIGPGLADFQQLHQRLTVLEGQGQTRAFDRLILATADNRKCHDHGDPFFRANCEQLIRQFDDPLYRWHLFSSGDSLDQIGLMAREPLLENGSGRVLGYLYAATLLSDNFALLNKLNAALGGFRLTVALTHQDRILVSNTRLDKAQRTAVAAALEHSHTGVRTGSLYARADGIRLDHETGVLQLVTIVPADSADHLAARMTGQAISALTLGTLLAILLSMVAVKLTLQPLVNLLHYTRAPDQRKELPKAGVVAEINQVIKLLAHHVNELDSSRLTLKRYSDELEATHREVQQSNQSLHQRSVELEQSNLRLEQLMTQNKSLLHQLFHLQEEERKHLAQELHDELGQTLAAVSTEAHIILQRLGRDHPDYPGAESIYHRAQEMYDVVYNRIVSLRPLPLNDLGLSEAIGHMPVLLQLQDQGCNVELDLPPLPRLAGEIEISLFRIAQEALNNSYRHAAATQVAVSLQFNRGTLQLVVRDNGKGFDVSKQQQLAGFGINGMRERCHAINGSLHLESGDKGTSLLAQVPIPTTALLTASP
nr:LuxQ periplasmic sensor domain-containing protein [Motiliproteus sediminis]